MLLTKDIILEKVENELYAEFSDFTSVESIVKCSKRLFDDYVLSKPEQIECIIPHIFEDDKGHTIENIRILSGYLAELCSNAVLEMHLLNISADRDHKYFLDICYAFYDNDVLSEDVIVEWYESEEAKEHHTDAVSKLDKLITYFNEAETESD